MVVVPLTASILSFWWVSLSSLMFNRFVFMVIEVYQTNTSVSSVISIIFVSSLCIFR